MREPKKGRRLMPREVWVLVHRLRRVEQRMEAARSAAINLRWVLLSIRWTEVWDEIPPRWQGWLARKEELRQERRQAREAAHA